MYRPAFVPVGEDQVSHVEITREIARRFNHLYGREPDFEAKAEKAVKSLGGRNSTTYKQLRRKFQETGDAAALERARALVQGNNRITVADRERLLGYLEGGGVTHPARAAGAAHRHAESARASMAARCRSPTATPSACAKTRTSVVREAAQDADGPGARAPHRSGRSGQMPGVGPAQDLFRRGDARLGRPGLPHRRHRLPRLQEAA